MKMWKKIFIVLVCFSMSAAVYVPKPVWAVEIPLENEIIAHIVLGVLFSLYWLSTDLNGRKQ